ncbi:MAG: response regulator transcription factor [Verrucomicrobia bacterium]|nr:response regulator transcription factor [Verrucomicrobiota bacterium]
MILIIDDDQEYVEELRDLLVKHGCHPVQTAATASEGLATVQNSHPQAVILDLMLPASPNDPVGPRFPKRGEEAAGVVLARKLRDGGFDLRRIIGITTLFSTEDLAPVRKLGVEKILCKPVPFSEILEEIKAVRSMAKPASR